MNITNYTPLFLRFLKQQKAYLPYRYNLYRSSGKTTKIWLCLHPINLPGAFLWENTKEGFQYWHNINYKYQQYVQELQNATLNREQKKTPPLP